MIKFPSGKEYKLVYFDTNFLSEFINNNNNFAANVLVKFINDDDPYMICTSIFNIFELSKTNEAFEEKMKLAFDKIPIGIVMDYQNLILKENSKSLKPNDIIYDAFGIKPPFLKDIHDLLFIVRNSQDSISKRNEIIINEISLWKKHRINKNIKNKESLLLFSMNEIIKSMNCNFTICSLGKYKSLECMGYIKNEFIYNTNNEIKSNTIIDMYNISILPYVEAYATENFVGKKIDNEMRRKFSYINAKVYYIKDFRTY